MLFKSGCVFIVLAVWLSTISCEKTVDVDLKDSPPQVVVDGYIETNQPPIVILTKTIGYFATIDLSTYENSFLHNAVIKVSNGTREVTLREYAVDTGTSNKFYFYTLDSADRSSFTFLGKVNEYYKLSVTAEGRTYESTVKIPDCKPLDSITSRLPDIPSAKTPTARILNVYYSDPDSFGNCIRYFTKRNSEPFLTASTSVYDDGLVNGAKSARLPLFLGYDHTHKTNDSTGYLFPGDTITIKWCAIDRSVFNFYATFEYATSSVGNPFSSPTNVRTNMSNGAIGVWAGYGVTTAIYVAPK